MHFPIELTNDLDPRVKIYLIKRASYNVHTAPFNRPTTKYFESKEIEREKKENDIELFVVCVLLFFFLVRRLFSVACVDVIHSLRVLHEP